MLAFTVLSHPKAVYRSLKERPSISQNLVVSLLPSILSFSREHRLAALFLLATPTATSSTRPRELLEKCIKGESIAIGVEGVRERIVIMGRLGQSIQDDDEVSAGIAIRWLIGERPSKVILQGAPIDPICSLDSTIQSQPTTPLVTGGGGSGCALREIRRYCVGPRFQTGENCARGS